MRCLSLGIYWQLSSTVKEGWGKSPTGMEIKVEGERMRRLLSLGAFPSTAGSDKCLKPCPFLVLGHVKDDRAAGFESCQDRLTIPDRGTLKCSR